MDAKIDRARSLERVGTPRVEEFDRVRLTRNLVGPEGAFEKGSIGTIVHVHRHGLAFEVEITTPVPAVVTVEAADVERLTD